MFYSNELISLRFPISNTKKENRFVLFRVIVTKNHIFVLT